MTEASTNTGDRPVWCITASVVPERPYGPGGAEQRRGLKLFSPGAKVYVADGFAGMGYDTVTVIGRVRRSSRYSIVDVRAERLTNWRVELVYSPTARDRITETRGTNQNGAFGLDDSNPESAGYRDGLAAVARRFQDRTDTDRAHWPGSAEPTTGGTVPASDTRGWFKRAIQRLAGLGACADPTSSEAGRGPGRS
jgi:hypothetical protein